LNRHVVVSIIFSIETLSRAVTYYNSFQLFDDLRHIQPYFNTMSIIVVAFCFEIIYNNLRINSTGCCFNTY
ncbi:hypothetical protein, partial [Streptococcus salivarius]|uniref:hypothetical protein n=1 Tax=Streptococcus salivarius TaxID=1304 RepID=UPI001C0CE263